MRSFVLRRVKAKLYHVLMGEEKCTLDLAFDFIPLSYDWVLKRLEGVERRIENLLGLGVSITLALPVAARVVTHGEGLHLTQYLISPLAQSSSSFLCRVQD